MFIKEFILKVYKAECEGWNEIQNQTTPQNSQEIQQRINKLISIKTNEEFFEWLDEYCGGDPEIIANYLIQIITE